MLQSTASEDNDDDGTCCDMFEQYMRVLYVMYPFIADSDKSDADAPCL